jgi:hypothetical protein
MLVFEIYPECEVPDWLEVGKLIECNGEGELCRVVEIRYPVVWLEYADTHYQLGWKSITQLYLPEY